MYGFCATSDSLIFSGVTPTPYWLPSTANLTRQKGYRDGENVLSWLHWNGLVLTVGAFVYFLCYAPKYMWVEPWHVVLVWHSYCRRAESTNPSCSTDIVGGVGGSRVTGRSLTRLSAVGRATYHSSGPLVISEQLRLIRQRTNSKAMIQLCVWNLAPMWMTAAWTVTPFAWFVWVTAGWGVNIQFMAVVTFMLVGPLETDQDTVVAMDWRCIIFLINRWKPCKFNIFIWIVVNQRSRSLRIKKDRIDKIENIIFNFSIGI